MIRREELAESCRLNAAAVGGEPTALDLAQGIVAHVLPASPVQAAAMAACWWPGWTPETLAALLAAGRYAAIAARYEAPTPARKGYSRAARALGKRPADVAEAVARGTESLYAWLARRATAKMDEKHVKDCKND